MPDPTPTSRAPRPGPASTLAPCDPVVETGIAHGIVCPPAMLARARMCRIRSIRCTSAGAVSAALIAAAEYGRDREGFEKLAALNEWLGSDAHLRELFQPARATRPLLTALLSLERRGRTPVAAPGLAGMVARFWSRLPNWVRVVFDVIPGALRDALPLRYWVATALGLVVGGAIDGVLARGLVAPGHPLALTVVAVVLPVMFVGGYVASVGACVWQLWRVASLELPRQGFGLCTGATPAPIAGTPALTNWLHERLQDLAGLPVDGTPLTVGALRCRRDPSGDADLGIDLYGVTANLELGRVIAWPDAANDFMFREGDMRRLFPGPVVDHLLASAHRPDHGDAVPAGYHALPAPTDMPVVVIARIMTSLPVVLSAVPLYLDVPGGPSLLPNEAAGQPPAPATVSDRHTPRRVWFGDRGQAAYFPARLLDAWLPVRPGFGIALTRRTRADADARIGLIEDLSISLETGRRAAAHAAGPERIRAPIVSPADRGDPDATPCI